MLHHADFQYEYSIEPTTKMNGHDPYEFVYADLPKTHHVLKKSAELFLLSRKDI